MKTNNIKIDRELFETLSPKTYNNFLFCPGDEIKIIAINPEKLLPWGKANVPALDIEVNGKPMEVPVNIILGTVVNRPEVVHNQGMGDLECVDFVNNTLFDNLKSDGGKFEKIIALPESIKIIKRISKGIPKEQVFKKKVMYEESFLVEVGKDFDSQFKELVFIPTIFKSAIGNMRTNGTYLIAVLD